MSDFLMALPWRLAAAAALIVGGVSFATGASDVWGVLTRVGIAFAAFFILGAIARSVLSATSPHPDGRHNDHLNHTTGNASQVGAGQSQSNGFQSPLVDPLLGDLAKDGLPKKSGSNDTNL